ncbi:MAG: DinB family protein [Fibrobacteria bacterium]
MPDPLHSSETLPFATLLRDFTNLRAFNLKFLANIGEDEALLVPRFPETFRNSLHWQLGHLLFTQGITLYEWCGVASPIPKGFQAYFGLGTSPEDYDPLVPDWDELLSLAAVQVRALPQDVAGRLQAPLRKPYKLMNITMTTAGETLPFLLAHEGEHLAHIKRLRKAVRP